MRITHTKLFRYDLPLKKGLTIYGKPLTRRRGIILQIINENGAAGFGEIAPLPGVSRETIPAVEEELLRLGPFLTETDLPGHLEDLRKHFTEWLGNQKLSPSVRFGIETAILNLLARVRKKTLAGIIEPEFEHRIRVNGLLQGTMASVVKEAKAMVKDGFPSVKLKVGSSRIDEDIEKVQAVSEALEEKALLRLDANQAWDLKDAVAFGKAVGIKLIEYIEEPLKNVEEIPEFYAETYLPVALDESLPTMDADKIAVPEGVDVLVIKPTLMGGLEKTWEIVADARHLGLRVIISSAYESGVGLDALANLAACYSRQVAVGLDTLKWFENDPLTDRLKIEHGGIAIPAHSLTEKDIDFSLLRELTS